MDLANTTTRRKFMKGVAAMTICVGAGCTYEDNRMGRNYILETKKLIEYYLSLSQRDYKTAFGVFLDLMNQSMSHPQYMVELKELNFNRTNRGAGIGSFADAFNFKYGLRDPEPELQESKLLKCNGFASVVYDIVHKSKDEDKGYLGLISKKDIAQIRDDKEISQAVDLAKSDPKAAYDLIYKKLERETNPYKNAFMMIFMIEYLLDPKKLEQSLDKEEALYISHKNPAQRSLAESLAR